MQRAVSFGVRRNSHDGCSSLRPHDAPPGDPYGMNHARRMTDGDYRRRHRLAMNLMA